VSHIVTIQAELRDLAAIKAACKRLGWEFVANKETFEWYGRYVGDYPVFQQQLLDLGIEVTDYGKCTHAIKVPGARYEIGLVAKGNKFVPLWDTWRPGGLQDVTNETGMNGFLAAYAVEKTKLEARRKGYQVKEHKADNGNVELEITVP
jgi:hypothetical protein